MDECRLGGTVLQRLQRFATQSHLMKLVLHIIMHEERAASCSSLDSFGSIDETMGKG